jgi:hypothetical protein
MDRCQSLKVLSLEDLDMDENHCRVLGENSRPGLEIELIHCKLTSAGTSALAEVLGRNEGPTKLTWCRMDNFSLANGLRGNSRLKSLRPRISINRDAGNRELLAIAGALRENEGLVEVNLRYNGFRVSDETWGAICDSLETHPALEVLDLSSTLTGAPLAPAALKYRIQALLDMIKVNTSIHTIRLDSPYGAHPTAHTRFTESRSFLISRRTGFGRACLPSKKQARLRTVPRCWDEPFFRFIPM